MTNVTPQAPAGWYPNPERPGVQTYWDGQGWTEHTAPLVAPTVARPTSTSNPTGIVGIVLAGFGFVMSFWFGLTGLLMILGLVGLILGIIAVCLTGKSKAEGYVAIGAGVLSVLVPMLIGIFS
jgi:hypothetical protein